MSDVWVLGEGPQPAKIMFVGERPGQEEYRSGRPFSEYGKSGKEIRRYLFNEGIRFEDCYVTNVCKDYIEGNPDPKPEEIERDTPLLIDELKQVLPTYVGAVGRFAARFFLGEDFDMEACHGLVHRIVFCISCGKIQTDSVREYSRTERVLDMDRSLLGRTLPRAEKTNNEDSRKTSTRSQISLPSDGGKRAIKQATASSLRKHSLRKSRTHGTTDPTPTPTLTSQGSVRERTSEKGERLQTQEQQNVCMSCVQSGSHSEMEKEIWIVPLYHPAYGLHSSHATPLVWDDFRSFGKLVRGEAVDALPEDQYPDAEYTLLKDTLPLFQVNASIYIDTEGNAECPWGLSFTQEPGKGYVILARNKALLKRFAAVIKKLNLEVVCHPVIHDMGVLRAMGVEFDRYRCTMTKAFLNTLVPQGLKPLARRTCGLVQQDYEDVMGQANKDKAIEWLIGAYEWANNRWPEESKTQSKRKTPASGGRKSKKTSPRLATNSRIILAQSL